MELIPFFCLAPALVAVAYFDLRYMRIPNALVLLAIALFVCTAPLLGWSELGARLLAAGLVFAVGFTLFALNMFGGGDVKMLAAVLLFVPSETHTLFTMVFAVAMFTGIGAILTARTVPALAGSSWAGLRGQGTFPMGISIAMAGLFHPFAVSLLA